MRLSAKFPAILGLVLSASTVFAAAQPAAAANEWLVRTGLEQPTAAALAADLGVDIVAVEHVTDDLYRVVTGAAEIDLRALVAARRDSALTRVQRNFIYRPFFEQPRRAQAPEAAVDNPPVEPADPSPARGPDPRVPAQWGLGTVDAAGAWAIQRGRRDVIVAVIDTGVDYNHEDLRASLWRNAGEIAGNGVDDDGNGYTDDVVGWDFADDDPLPYDKMSPSRFDGNPGHGTHCAGVVGGAGENALGISGIAPEISIMGLRFITDQGEGTTADAIRAIKYAVANGATVLSNSWGGEAGDEDDTELKQAIQEAEDAGVLLIFAAGNGRSGVGYNNDSDAKPAIPASFDHDAIVSVAATDVRDALGVFSNFGARTVDLAAPGVKVMSSVPGSLYEDTITILGLPIAEWSGTSMATPHVAGVAALIWSQYPDLTAAEVKDRLLNSVTRVAGLTGKVKSGGVLNAARALQ